MKTLLKIIFCCLTSILFAQSPGDLPPNAEPGKCYAKCLNFKYSEEKFEEEIPVFTGDKYDETVEREWRELVTENEEGELESIMVEVVLDESDGTKFEYRSFIFIEKTPKSRGFTEWFEVLCADKLTSDIIRQIKNALREKGYEFPMKNKDYNFGSDTKDALKKFQRENGLPIGNLDLETLDELGIDY